MASKCGGERERKQNKINKNNKVKQITTQKTKCESHEKAVGKGSTFPEPLSAPVV